MKFFANNCDYYNRQYSLYRDGFVNDDDKNTWENLNSNELQEKSDINNNNTINYHGIIIDFSQK